MRIFIHTFSLPKLYPETIFSIIKIVVGVIKKTNLDYIFIILVVSLK